MVGKSLRRPAFVFLALERIGLRFQISPAKESSILPTSHSAPFHPVILPILRLCDIPRSFL
jgi:hypothetical protein